MENDYHLRHGSMLRKLSKFRPHNHYIHAEVINHSDRQYDPARHETAVLYFGEHTVIITKLNTPILT